MSEEFYWVLFATEDGGQCYRYTKETLEAELQTDHTIIDKGFFDGLPSSQYATIENDMSYWPGKNALSATSKVLIIKGSVVVPKIKKYAAWEID